MEVLQILPISMLKVYFDINSTNQAIKMSFLGYFDIKIYLYSLKFENHGFWEQFLLPIIPFQLEILLKPL